ncbi:hypothetical protein F5J12DRAFT_805362 [Pisolithus orientalis]|uniref:uncharacterized protein n=1 Tax=Pisolithus orientalis TaxID=936130 RepID=UPI0022248412|nr:uncharacterized protein F5J12DRAFT_805362 [Pisolithus orientalis]KAI6028429.1 hypothetical protein F5J12DRAFT_805362 [Pisolithus orientalis]
MPRRAVAHGKSGRLKQRTLHDLVYSSPPSSPPPMKHQFLSNRKRRALTPSESEESSRSSSSDERNDDSDVGAVRFEAETGETSDGDASPRRPKRKRVRLATDSLDERSPDDEEVNVGIPVQWKGKGKGKRKTVVDSDGESEPHRPRLIKGARPPTPDDEEDEVDESHILESRLRARGRKTKYQETLEKLRRRKRGNSAPQSSSGDEETPQEPNDPESLSCSEGSDDQSNDTEEDDFIVEDPVDGVQTIDLPVAFSMTTHQDLAHHFKIICQLFVHMAVRPLPERRHFMQHVLKNEQYFSLPLQVTRRKLLGMRDSLVVSSTWGPDFKKLLEKYPGFTLFRMDFSLPGCDACKLGGRTSTLVGRVSGTPYDEYDFEDIIDDDEDTDKKEFHLGRFCARRTRVYHGFNHWEYWLYKSLQRQIAAVVDDDNDFVKVAYVGGALPPDDPQDADKFMEWLDQRGIIDMEWQKIRQMMESARNLESRGEMDDLE